MLYVRDCITFSYTHTLRNYPFQNVTSKCAHKPIYKQFLSAIGENLSTMILYYFKSVDTNPTSDPLLNFRLSWV